MTNIPFSESRLSQTFIANPNRHFSLLLPFPPQSPKSRKALPLQSPPPLGRHFRLHRHFRLSKFSASGVASGGSFPSFPRCVDLLYWFFAIDGASFKVNNIRGYPASVNQIYFTGSYALKGMRIGVVAGMIGLTEAIAIGRTFAGMKDYQLNGNKEMVALGTMNIIGSMTSCYVATGSFSGSAVNYMAGCKTAVSNIIMSLVVLLTLLLIICGTSGIA